MQPKIEIIGDANKCLPYLKWAKNQWALREGSWQKQLDTCIIYFKRSGDYGYILFQASVITGITTTTTIKTEDTAETAVYFEGDVNSYEFPFKVRYWHNSDFSEIVTWDTQHYNKYVDNYLENGKIYSESFGEVLIPVGSILQGCGITVSGVFLAILDINKKTYLYKYDGQWVELKELGVSNGEWYFSEDGVTATSSASVLTISETDIVIKANTNSLIESGTSYLSVESAKVSGSIKKQVEPSIDVVESVTINERTERVGGDGSEDLITTKVPVYVVSDKAPAFLITGPNSNVWNGSTFSAGLVGPHCQGECPTVLWTTDKGSISSTGVLSGLSSPTHNGCVNITATCADSGQTTTWKAGLITYNLSTPTVLVNTGMTPQRTYDEMVYTYGEYGLISGTRVIKGYYAALCMCDILRANWPTVGSMLHSPKEVPPDNPALPAPVYINCTPCGEWNGSTDNCRNKYYCCGTYSYCWYLVYHATQTITGC